MSVAAEPTSVRTEHPTSHGEERFVLHRVPWHVYATMRDSSDQAGEHVRLTYLQGELELMSPSPEHEESKALIGRLLEAWCFDQGIEVFAQGSTTLRDERVERGLEADESYSVGTRKPIPDLAIEVVYQSYRVDKLETYRGLGVPEVWVFRDGRISVFVRGDAGYETRTASALFPTLDLELLARHVVPGTGLLATTRAFRNALQSR